MMKDFRILPFCFIILFYSLSGCKDPDNVGINVLPEGDLTGIGMIDTVSMVVSTVREDSIPADANTLNLLGAYTDNVFGYSNASFYSQVLLKTPNASFGTNPICDSIVLTLDYAGYYGDTSINSTHVFTVYELSESINVDSSYYSNRTFTTSTLWGTVTTTEILPTDSLVISGTTVSPHLRLKLDSVLGEKFLNADPSSYFDNTSFLNFFKGIYVRETVTTGNGCILYFSLTEVMSKLTLYYNSSSGSSLSYEFLLNGDGRVNHFEHDYSLASFGNVFPVDGSTSSYIQSMAGVKTKIEFPYLDKLIQQGNIAINNAQLIIKGDNTDAGLYPLHSKLGLTGRDSLGKSYFLPDNIDSPDDFGGDLTSQNSYTFNITRYLQQVLSGSRKDYGLFLVASGSSVNANRTIIGGSAHPSLKMKLQLTYTKIN